MLDGKTIAFVGSGNMAEAMISGLLAKNLISPDCIFATGPREARAKELGEKYGIRASIQNQDACLADIIVLSIKPKPTIKAKVFEELRGKLKSEALVISIMAGVSLETITEGLGTHNVIRCMPNTPGKIGMGITGFTSSRLEEEQLECGREILAALGEKIFFENEADLHTVTGISGTGPAYVALIAEAMVAAAVQRGLSFRDAKSLILHTIRGTAELALRSPLHLAELRDEVTSPGGTTAAALYAMEKGGLRTVIADGIHAACERSIALGRK